MSVLESFKSATEIRVDLWNRLRLGVTEPSHPFRFATVAITSLDGAPTARTIVLRSADESARQLVFCTDGRSPKVELLRHQPRVGWVLWDPADKLQLRIDS